MRLATIVWTVLPNGSRQAPNGVLARLSILVTFRLSADDAGPSLSLDDFPSIRDWPDTLAAATLRIYFEDGTNVILSSDQKVDLYPSKNGSLVEPRLLWQRFFDKDCVVAAGQIDPAAGNSSSPSISIPSREIITAAETHYTEVTNQQAPSAPSAQTRQALKDVSAFHEAVTDGAQYSSRRGAAQSGIHKGRLEFHRRVAALSQYPSLLRALGLVLDYEVPATAGSLAGTSVIVVPESKAAQTRHFIQWTHYRSSPRFECVASSSEYQRQYAGGFVNLALANDEGTPAFVFEQLDPFVEAEHLKQLHDTLGNDESAHLCSRQSNGIALFRNDLKHVLEQRRNANAVLTATTRTDNLGIASPVEMPQGVSIGKEIFLEDTVRGYAVDVKREEANGRWLSLCKRTCEVTIDENTHFDFDEEGWAVLPAMLAGKAGDSLAIHESLFRWQGWSISAPRPGKGPSSGTTSELTSGDDSVLPGVSLRIAAAKASLPKLRFGELYRFRVRYVDLAGNALPGNAPSSDFGRELPPEGYAYLRFEPVQVPTVVFQRAPLPGESLYDLVIRKSHSGASDVDRSARHILPPKVSPLAAEMHGVFDAVWGTDSSHQILSTHDDVQQSVEPSDSMALPFLPDPLAKGATIAFLDDQGSVTEIVGPISPGKPWISFNVGWPTDKTGNDALTYHAWRLELHPKDVNESKRWDIVPGAGANAVSVVRVFLAPAEQIRARLSSQIMVDVDDLSALGLLAAWARFVPANERSRREGFRRKVIGGQHDAFTPGQEVRFVHAVQRPLLPFELDEDVSVSRRNMAQQPVELRVNNMKIDGPSTARLDITASWCEWDDRRAAAPKLSLHSAPVANNVTISQTRFLHDFTVIHDFTDTKHRRATLKFTGTSRFTSYFASGGESAEFTRSCESKAILIKSSAPPPVCSVRRVKPTWEWEHWTDDTEKDTVRNSRRIGGGLRVYLERPWYESGDGELLGVIIRATDIAEEDVFTEIGADPTRKDEAVSGIGHFSLFPVTDVGVKDVEYSIPGTSKTVAVRLYGFPCHFDGDQGLWYADLQIRRGLNFREEVPAYMPFVRLAVARYQPNSEVGSFISPIVKGAYTQLVNDRWIKLTVKFLYVTVLVLAPHCSSDAIFEVHFERFDQTIGSPGDELAWSAIPSTVQRLTKISDDSYSRAPIDTRSLGTHIRLVVRECEIYTSDEGEQLREVYCDAIEL